MKLFVYGTLMRGECNQGRLQQARFLYVDRTPPCFSLVNLGPYPGLLPSGNTSVCGEVYEVDDDLFAALDEFEEHPDLYVRTSIELQSSCRAFAYLLRPEHATASTPLPSGDWRRWPFVDAGRTGG